MTAEENNPDLPDPREILLKLLTGKWKPRIFKHAVEGPVRFGQMSRLIPNINRQALASALHELEDNNILQRKVIKLKPLHIEYSLTGRGIEFIPVFKEIEKLGPGGWHDPV